MIIRVLAFAVGLALAAAMANANVASAGGYGTTLSYVVLTMAAGIVIGSIVIGHSLAQKRILLAGFLCVGMFAGELYNFVSSADRVILSAENVQAPLKDALQRHDAALQALAEAQAEKPSPASRDRLDAAERAKDNADKAAREQASLPGCRKNCADLLQAAVNSAAREVEAARIELGDHDRIEARRIADKVARAETALAAAPLPASATPFADRIGMSPSTFDLLKAALLAIGFNGIAAALIAFAAHGAKPAKTATPVKVEAPTAEVIAPPAKKMASTNVVKLAQPAKAAVLSILDFGADHLEPAPGDTLDFDEFFNAYAAAAKAVKLNAYGPVEFVEPFKQLCDEAGIRVRKRGQKVFLCDVKLAS